MKTAIINARVRPDLKSDVENILSQLGITTTQAITMYFEKLKLAMASLLAWLYQMMKP